MMCFMPIRRKKNTNQQGAWTWPSKPRHDQPVFLRPCVHWLESKAHASFMFLYIYINLFELHLSNYLVIMIFFKKIRVFFIVVLSIIL